MKKIFLFFLLLFLLTGCFDYIELNELSIISMIIIDKQENNYNISFEILNDQKQGEKSTINKSIIIKGSGKTLAQAIENATLKTPKKAYLAHLKVLAISKDVAKTNLKQVTEYFLRSPYIRNEFYMIIVDNENADDILKVNKEEIPIISDYVSTMLKDNQKSFNNVTNNNFENILIDIAEKGKDAVIPVIKIEGQNLKAEGTALLDKYVLKTILDVKESSLLNVLTNDAANTLFTYACPNDESNKISISLYSGKTSLEIKDRDVFINSKLMAEIQEYNCNEDLKDTTTFKKYNKYYSLKIKNDIESLYTKMRKLNTDSIGIGKTLYIKRRYYKENNWHNLDYKINVDLKINKEGLIYEVTNGN